MRPRRPHVDTEVAPHIPIFTDELGYSRRFSSIPLLCLLVLFCAPKQVELNSSPAGCSNQLGYCGEPFNIEEGGVDDCSAMCPCEQLLETDALSHGTPSPS